MAYTTINKPNEHFDTVIWDTVDTSIDTLNFAPDAAWIKIRDNADSHCMFDTVRGATKRITIGQSSAESTQSAELTAFNSNGYTLGTGDNVNRASKKACSWNWKGGGTAVSNTDGTITSSISANTTSGFSIVTYSGNGTAGATVGHGLGVAPAMIWIKRRGTADGWIVYHHKHLTSNPATVHSRLDTTAVSSDDNTKFNDTEPTSSVFSIGNDTAVNSSSDTYVAYCFAEKKGFCKIGTYEGSGSGSFIYLGFKPAYLIVKGIDEAKNWLTQTARISDFNAVQRMIFANGASSEENNSVYSTDFLSNGIKIRGTNGNLNTSAKTYIYMAIAEAPLVGTNNVPATAR
jgi:hypothetical protein